MLVEVSAGFEPVSVYCIVEQLHISDDQHHVMLSKLHGIVCHAIILIICSLLCDLLCMYSSTCIHPFMTSVASMYLSLCIYST